MTTNKCMRVLVVCPGKSPRVSEISGSLKSLQELVGGTIQAVYPFEEPVALVCNDEGKLLGLPLNRALYLPGARQSYDIIAGTFFVCGISGDTFTSLTDEEIRIFRQRFLCPEEFIRIGNQIVPIPMKEEENHAHP